MTLISRHSDQYTKNRTAFYYASLILPCQTIGGFERRGSNACTLSAKPGNLVQIPNIDGYQQQWPYLLL
jgi:hypothetical protein